MRQRDLRWWLYQPYKYLVFAPVVGVVTTVQASLALFLSLVISPRSASRLSAVPWARILALATPMRVRVEGRENIDPQQSYVLVSNHQSQFDIFLLYGWLGVDFKWVMKQELRTVPGIGMACDRLGHIFIDRSNHTAAMATLEEAKKKIVNGTSVMFFPEGTRSRDGKLMQFKKGAFRMALDLGLPILPLTVTGTRNVLPAGTSDLMPGSARLIIHPPIRVEGFTAAACSQLSDQVRKVIASALPSDQI
ncbi:MAG: 1-acyl-sn-glycerol-3-phosphate acyltransferase [Acidobacteriota bacterium]|jgi:1-acyl-sn-glycerol-3-phosphate acyltransferase|nr:1-acyl-sn-glycerol-3-phosphate acyltransferase [Acidobacteriota bacterium]